MKNWISTSETKVIEEKPATGPQNLILEPAPPPSKTHPWKTGGLIAMGLGGAALVAGGVTGYLAIEQKKEVDSVCDANYVCPNGGIETAFFVIPGA